MRIWKIMGIAGVLLLAAAAQRVSALDVQSTTIGDNGSSPKTITLHHRLYGVTNPVSVNYRYQIIPDEGNPAEVGQLQRYYDVSWDNVVPADGSASLSYALDLSGLSFSKTGDYKFLIKEYSSNSSTTYPKDSETQYYFNVAVRNDLNGSNVPTGDLIATLGAQVQKVGSLEKYDEALFESSATFSYIKVRSIVSGNMADPEKYFRYKINLNNATAGDRFTVVGQDSEVIYGGEILTPANELVAGEDNYIYLKHGQEATIGVYDILNQMPIGLVYSIESDEQLNYDSFIDGEMALLSAEKTVQKVPSANAQTSTKERFVAQNETDIRHNYEAESAGAVLTGVVSKAAPYMLAISAAGIGLFLVGKRAKRE